MKIVDNIAVKNPCYKAGIKIVPKGGMLHSVGCSQPDSAVFASLWNSSDAKVCVHAVVGKDGVIRQLLPWDYRAWHCGSGKNGSGNNSLISIEMTEPKTIKYTGGANWVELGDGSETKAHVLATYRHAVEFFAYIAKEYGFNPLDSACLMSHQEGHKKGIASNHGDVEHIWFKFGLTMDGFRKDVKMAMDGLCPDSMFQVKVEIEDLKIRKGPGVIYDFHKTGENVLFTGSGIFTIVKTADGAGAKKWGLLKSYKENEDGWISMNYAKRL